MFAEYSGDYHSLTTSNTNQNSLGCIHSSIAVDAATTTIPCFFPSKPLKGGRKALGLVFLYLTDLGVFYCPLSQPKLTSGLVSPCGYSRAMV